MAGPENAPFSSFAPPVRAPTPLRRAITAAARAPEPECVVPLLEAATLDPALRETVRGTARTLIERLRARPSGGPVHALIQEYALSSQEGVALMCLAEALLRIPDNATRDALIRDKIARGAWARHLGEGRSLFVNAATWGLVATGKLVASADDRGLSAALTRLLARLGEPVVRRGVDIAMRLMGEQFVTAETIGEALGRAPAMEARGFAYSYDMLGEAAMTADDAGRYYTAYAAAIHAIGGASAGRGVYSGPGISIKLSALHPRYGRAQAERVMSELLPRLADLARSAKAYDIGLNIDAEEADRLELSLDLLQSLAEDPELAGWDGLGFVVQAYGKRCPRVVDFIVALARATGRRIMVRLVKGAYWDAEIKRAQVAGLDGYPVYTRKAYTDLAYVACARKLLAARDAVFPQFATHNAQTLATIYHLAGPDFRLGDWEFQCLHGMGEPLYEEVVGPGKLGRPCRIYAPVGTHDTLLAYLVRRLLENGANSSFVHRVGDPKVAVEDLLADPAEQVRAMEQPGTPHEAIPLPTDILAPRRNSAGCDLADENVLATLGAAGRGTAARVWTAAPAEGGAIGREVRNPADSDDVVGTVRDASASEARESVAKAAAAAATWAAVPVRARAEMLERAADALQAEMPVLAGLIVREAGKSIANAISEVREAIDFLRYYAAEARRTFGMGERPLGPVVCISPWNFPLAIFTGQVAAALVAGNPVLAKPAEETPLIAAQAVRLLHAAGVPRDVLQLVPGPGEVGAALVAAPDAAGVVFTGSTQVARLIERQLAGRTAADGRPIPLIAETGGRNAMIVDSSALAEQAVADVLTSAFDSAGQRCSALRLLCLQEEIAERTLTMLKGAMAELTIGRPDALRVDVGPVITSAAQADIERHVEAMRAAAYPVTRLALPAECAGGTFVAPTIVELDAVEQLDHEVFGPVLHVVRYPATRLDELVAAINAGGWALTFGLHTRLDAAAERVTARVQAGNVYVNRNMIGAVVGVQPFGGHGLSGTGPKAGGPLYLTRLVADPAPTAYRLPAAPALTAFATWLEKRGEHGAAARTRETAAFSPAGLDVELPGPVGERNRYLCRPRGLVALCPRTAGGLWEQLAATLATGNRAVAARDRIAWLADLPAQVAGSVIWSDAPLAEAGLGAALIEDAADVPGVGRALAARAGAIVPHQLRGPRGYVLAWLVEEIAISTNTAAAGGNASLLTIA